MTRRPNLFALLCLLIASLPGCGFLQASYARQVSLTEDLDAYVIEQPLKEVWSQATLSTNGGRSFAGAFGLNWNETGRFTMRTTPDKDREESLGDKRVVVTWFECEGHAVRGGSQVRYIEITETTTYRGREKIGTNRSETRRFDLELELIRKFDPKVADRIEAASERAADAAG